MTSLGSEHSLKYQLKYSTTNLQGTRLRVRPCGKFICESKVIRNYSDFTSIFDWLRELTPLSKPSNTELKPTASWSSAFLDLYKHQVHEFSLALCDNSRVSE